MKDGVFALNQSYFSMREFCALLFNEVATHERRVNQQVLGVCLNKPKQSTRLLVLFASLGSGWATTNGIDCLAPKGNKRKVSFPRTQ